MVIKLKIMSYETLNIWCGMVWFVVWCGVVSGGVVCSVVLCVVWCVDTNT
jgi:hypothetical protein